MEKRGFTLLEVLVALLILVLSFSVLLGLITQSLKTSRSAQNFLQRFLCLDNSYKEGKLDRLSVRSIKLEKYGLSITVYSCGALRFYEVER